MVFKMIIKKTAVGNKNEAFIESDFHKGLNIISSDDNNKGKTIEIQSMMYALGNDPAFPTTFEYKDYYHYIEFEVDGTTYKLCRFNNGFVLKHDSVLMLFDNVSELKRYWNKHIFTLPNIVKNQISKIVDPVLFLQLFFVGQDKKDTSNISHAGFYNEADFYNMLYDICDLSGLELDEDEIKKIKEEIKLDRESITFDELKEMSKHPFINIQSHTYNHPILTNVNDKQLDFELCESKKYLSALLNKEIDTFSYPNGSFGKREEDAVSKYYQCGYTTEEKFVQPGSNLYRIPRTCLVDNYWSNLSRIVGAWKLFKKIF